jgi:hypothetical protein
VIHYFSHLCHAKAVRKTRTPRHKAYCMFPPPKKIELALLELLFFLFLLHRFCFFFLSSLLLLFIFISSSLILTQRSLLSSLHLLWQDSQLQNWLSLFPSRRVNLQQSSISHLSGQERERDRSLFTSFDARPPSLLQQLPNTRREENRRSKRHEDGYLPDSCSQARPLHCHPRRYHL